MIEWIYAAIKVGLLIVIGLSVMGLIGLGYAMAVFSWERLRDLWRRE